MQNVVYFCTLEDYKMKLALTFKSKARQLTAYIKTQSRFLISLTCVRFGSEG